jgi:hypothetical protein
MRSWSPSFQCGIQRTNATISNVTGETCDVLSFLQERVEFPERNFAGCAWESLNSLSSFYFYPSRSGIALTMDSLPPNDPNNNGNRSATQGKPAPYEGRNRRSARAVQGEAPMDVMGDMRDAPAVVVMFLIGVAAWLLRERCVC